MEIYIINIKIIIEYFNNLQIQIFLKNNRYTSQFLYILYKNNDYIR